MHYFILSPQQLYEDGQYSHCTDEESGLERSDNLPKLRKLGCKGAGVFQTSSLSCPQMTEIPAPQPSARGTATLQIWSHLPFLTWRPLLTTHCFSRVLSYLHGFAHALLFDSQLSPSSPALYSQTEGAVFFSQNTCSILSDPLLWPLELSAASLSCECHVSCATTVGLCGCSQREGETKGKV